MVADGIYLFLRLLHPLIVSMRTSMCLQGSEMAQGVSVKTGNPMCMPSRQIRTLAKPPFLPYVEQNTQEPHAIGSRVVSL